MMASKKKKYTPKQLRLRNILKQVSGDVVDIEGDLIPPAIIKGKGILYCYEPASREFVKICRGVKAFVVEEEDSLGKVLIYTIEGLLVEIEASEIEMIGFD